MRPADRGEHADLVHRLGPLLCRHAPRVHLLYRVDLLVLGSSRLVDGAKGALAEEFEQLEVPHIAQASHARSAPVGRGWAAGDAVLARRLRQGFALTGEKLASKARVQNGT